LITRIIFGEECRS